MTLDLVLVVTMLVLFMCLLHHMFYHHYNLITLLKNIEIEAVIEEKFVVTSFVFY